LPFSAWYPYDTKISPLYEITYLYQIIGIWFLTVGAVNMDTLIAALMMYIATQCDILCDDLKNLHHDFDRKLINCVKHHREIVAPLSSASVSHLIYVTAITSQIFLYSWYGNEVEIKVRIMQTNFVN
ncbi:7tm 6 domain containing protein, partial [Asbolus verrucosus]